LKAQDLPHVRQLISDVLPNCSVLFKETPLTKAQLRGYNVTEQADLVVLHHRHEGRLFMTDRNGLFHDFLASAYSKTSGRVLIVITNCSAQPSEEALTTEEVANIAKFGDQPTMGALSTLGKVLSWESAATPVQLKHIHQALVSAAFYRNPPMFSGLPQEFSAQVVEKEAFSCALL
jgi:hypothetical protein